MTLLIACNCVACESFFPLAIMADKQMFKALLMVELLGGNDEKLVKEKRGNALFYKYCTRIAIGIYWGVSRDDEDGFQNFNENLNLHAPDITPQEIINGNKVISVAERLTVTLRFSAPGERFIHWVFNSEFLIQ